MTASTRRRERSHHRIGLVTFAMLLLAPTVGSSSAAPLQEAEAELVRDSETARKIVERALEAYRSLRSYRHDAVTQFDFETNEAAADAGVQDTTNHGTLAFAAPDRFAISMRSHLVVSDGTTIWVHNKDLGQYVPAVRSDLKSPVESWLQSLSERQVSLSFVAEALIDREAGAEDLLDGFAAFAGLRAEVRGGKPGHWVIADVRDPWYRSGEMIRVELWFDEQTGLLQESRGDFTDAYHFALSFSRGWWSNEDDDVPAVTRAVWTSSYTNIVTNKDLAPETFTFTPADTDRRVDRFQQRPRPTYGRADQLRLIGKPAPAFRGQILEGEELALADLRGQIVVLDFWAMWCAPCVRAIPHIQEVADRFREQPVTVLGVNRDRRGSERALRGFLTKRGITFDHVMDGDGAIAGKYRVTGIPTTVLIDAEGVIQDVSVGFAPGQEETLIRQVEDLLAGKGLLDEQDLEDRIARAGREHDMPRRLGFESPELLALIGKPAPPLEAEDLEGQPVRLGDLGGEPVLLYFWLRAGEARDGRLIGERDIHRAVHDAASRAGDRIQAIGIFADRWQPPEDIREALRDEEITTPQVLDEFGEIAERFGVKSYPSVVLIDREGIVQDVSTGYRTGLDRELSDKIDRLLADESLIDERELALRRNGAEERRDRFGGFPGQESLAVETAGPDLLEAVGKLAVMGHELTSVDVDGDGASEPIMGAGGNIIAIVASDGLSLRRLRLQGLPTRSAQIMELEPVRLDGEIHWFASATSWEDLGRGSIVGLFAPDGEQLWQFEPPAATAELEAGERLSASAKLAAGDLDGDGVPELVVGLTYMKWSKTGRPMGSVGSHIAGHLIVVDPAGAIISQTEIGSSINMLKVIPTPEPDGGSLILCGTNGALYRYRFDRVGSARRD